MHKQYIHDAYSMQMMQMKYLYNTNAILIQYKCNTNTIHMQYQYDTNTTHYVTDRMLYNILQYNTINAVDYRTWI